MEPLTYILDASSVVRYLERAPGASRIETILIQDPGASILIPAITWGEICYVIEKLFGSTRFQDFAELFMHSFEITPISADVAVRAAQIKTALSLGYADCFLVELALRTPAHKLITADYGFKRAEHLIDIEFLPGRA